MVSKTELDDSFPECQLLIKDFHSPFRFDHNWNGRGIMIYVREDIPAKLLSHDFLSPENFFLEINLYKKKWRISCSYNSHKRSIGKHLDIISKSLDALSTKYENIVLLDDFNACVMMRLHKHFANFIIFITLLNNLHALKILITLAGLI